MSQNLHMFEVSAKRIIFTALIRSLLTGRLSILSPAAAAADAAATSSGVGSRTSQWLSKSLRRRTLLVTEPRGCLSCAATVADVVIVVVVVVVDDDDDDDVDLEAVVCLPSSS